MKTTNFEQLLIKNAFWCKTYHESAHFSISHTDAHDRLDDFSTHHKPHFPQITSVFKPSHNVERSAEERFAMDRMATRGFGAKKIAAALGVQRSAGCGGCARTAPWRRATSGKNTSFDTPWHTPQTPTAPQRQTTRGKTCCFVTHIPNRNFDPSNLKMGQGVPIT